MPILGGRSFGRWVVSSLGGGVGPWWWAIFTETTSPTQFWDTDLATDDAGNAYYIYSASSASSSGVQEPKVFKLTNSGIVTWARRLFGSAWSQNSTKVTYQRSRVILSGVNGTGSIQYNYAQTLNADGTSTAVSRSLQIPGYRDATSQHTAATIDTSDNIYNSGAFLNFAMTDYNDFITQYTAAGAIGWTRFWTGNDPRSSLKWANNSLYFHRFAGLYKFNSAGTLINSRQISLSSGSVTSFGLKFDIDASENQYRAGASSSFGFLGKFDSDLLMTWGKSFTLSGINAYGSGSAIDSAGNIYAMYQLPGQNKSIYIVKASTTGTILWTRSFAFRISGTHPYNNKAALAVYSNSDIILTMNQDTTTNRPQIVVKLPADGTKTGTYTSGAYAFDWTAETPTFTTLSATYATPGAPNTGSASAGAGVPSNSAWTSYAVTKTDIPA
jgi:hypothetical protein